MNITKYTHSCVYVEDEDLTFLFDPGIYSVQNGLRSELFTKLDYLLITHEHEDHFDINFVKEIASKFPNIKIKTTDSVVKTLKDNTINSSSDSDDVVEMQIIPHERLFDKTPPENVSISIRKTLTHVGDSFQLNKKAEIIAFPIQAPWGSYVEAIEKIVQIKPKVLIPIHDWHWKDEVRISMHKRARDYLSSYGVQVLAVEHGVKVQL